MNVAADVTPAAHGMVEDAYDMELAANTDAEMCTKQLMMLLIGFSASADFPASRTPF